MKRHATVVPVLVLLVALGVTAGGVWSTYRNNQATGDLEFLRRADRLSTEIQRRVNLCVYGLMGARGTYKASANVTRADFRAYVDSRDLPREFPGAIGFGAIERVPRDELADFVARQRADNAPDFQVKTSGDADDLYVIKYIDPLSRNLQAWGYDVGSERRRRETVERAVLTGEPTLTPPLDLVQEDDNVAGFLYLVPVFRSGMPRNTPEQKFEALQVIVYAPIVIDEAFHDVSEYTQGMLDFVIHDVDDTERTSPLYDYTGVRGTETYKGRYSASKTFVVGGRTWSVTTYSTSQFDALVRRTTPMVVGSSGLLLSFFLAGLVWALTQSRARALDLATSMTAELAKSESQFRSLVNNIPGTSYRCLLDDTWTMLYVSNDVEDLTGYPAREFLQNDVRTFESVIHPDDRPVVFDEVQLSAKKRTTYTISYRIIRKDGEVRWVRERGKAFYASLTDTTPEYLEGVIFDITDQVEAEELLASEQARLTAFVRHAPAAVAMFDREIRYIAVSERWIKDYGLEGEKLLGRSHYDVFPNVPQRWKDIHARCLAGAVERADSDTWFPDVSESPQVLRWEVRPWYDGQGTIAGIMMFTQDITQDKLLERTLEERNTKLTAAMVELGEARNAADAANQSKSEFLANMSHEIRTPLTAIVGYTEVLREESPEESTSPRQLEAIDTIQRAGRHLLMIINDILDISKIEAGKMSIESIETDLAGVIVDIDSLMAPRAASKGVNLTTRLLTPIPERVYSDPTRLRQILLNVIGNAVKFTNAGSIDVRVSCTDDTLAIEIEDTGPGMTAEQSSALFSPFTQADSSMARKYGGTGLGLAISRRLATLLGGELEVVHTKLGEGTCFGLWIPLRPFPDTPYVDDLATYAERVEDEHTEELITLSGRILLVEDNPVNQRLILHHLRRAGAEVELAENGQLALDRLQSERERQERFDLIVSDMQMPEMDGYTMARSIREWGSDIPIIALTAQAMTEDRQACLDAGCNDYATKPIDKQEFLAKCRRWLASN